MKITRKILKDTANVEIYTYFYEIEDLKKLASKPYVFAIDLGAGEVIENIRLEYRTDLLTVLRVSLRFVKSLGIEYNYEFNQFVNYIITIDNEKIYVKI